MNKIAIKELIDGNPYLRKRSEIYPQLQRMFFKEYGIWLEIEQMKKLIRAHRSFQELIPNDEFGARKEKQWLKDRGMQSQGEAVAEAQVLENGQMLLINN